MAICGRGWSRRCREANPYTECRCSCGGVNHGVEHPYSRGSPVTARRSTSSSPYTSTYTSTPPPVPPVDPVPPILENDDGEIIPLERKEWLDTGLDNKNAFALALQEIGLNQNLVRHGLYRYDSAIRQAISRGADFEAERRRELRTLRDWLANFLKRRKEVVIETTNLLVKLPIFRLHSPKIERSKVSYIESQTDGSVGDCVVTIFGTGMGASQSFTVKYTNTFVCSNGDCKLIYVPVTIKADRIRVFEGERFIKEHLRTEMILKNREKISKAIESIPEEECSRDLDIVDFDQVFDYSGDRSIDIHKVEWSLSWKDTIETKLGLNAFNIKTECRASITYEKAIEFFFELPAGHKYGLKQIGAVRGISWAVDHQPKKEFLTEESTHSDIREHASASDNAVSPERNSDTKKRTVWRSLTTSIDALRRKLRKNDD